jgi:Zn-dependent protease with chaperone function
MQTRGEIVKLLFIELPKFYIVYAMCLGVIALCHRIFGKSTITTAATIVLSFVALIVTQIFLTEFALKCEREADKDKDKDL